MKESSLREKVGRFFASSPSSSTRATCKDSLSTDWSKIESRIINHLSRKAECPAGLSLRSSIPTRPQLLPRLIPSPLSQHLRSAHPSCQLQLLRSVLADAEQKGSSCSVCAKPLLLQVCTAVSFALGASKRFEGTSTMGSSPFRNTNTNAPTSAVCHPQLTSSLAAHNHQCNRFCSFKYQFGNVWLCTSSGKHHICDRTCDQRIFWGELLCRRSTLLKRTHACSLRLTCQLAAQGIITPYAGSARS